MGHFNFKPILGIASLLTLGVFPGLAVDLGNGTTIFNKSPRLVKTITTSSGIRVKGAKYYFTIELGDDVGEPLEKLTLQQVQTIQIINFDLDETFAFEGEPNNRGKSLPIARIKKNLDNGVITLIFDYPIASGTTFTVGLKPQQNPDSAGVYTFSLTAYPKGQKSLGLYLGLGRLHFSQQDNHFP
ncbi:DUF2808 domain-containing protein [Cyanobacterium sp. uoEpiScrs1]|uniref:DUF2808 domain-containing protein n=1 Tax=Cyanobacterium sp. uoEpiScrs1 TaxID=2976343 RepID=UPI00226AC55C|nr:DUF2808 domain-containing protein [Cyanobacterium sp. uoEpiScrs1]